MIAIGVPPHHIGGFTLGVAQTEAHVGFDMLSVLFFIDIVEVVAQEDGMFLAVART